MVSVAADLAGVLHAVQRRLAGKPSARLVEHGGECRIIASWLIRSSCPSAMRKMRWRSRSASECRIAAVRRSR